MRLARWVYKTALRLLPQAFRDAYAKDMTLTFEEKLTAARGRGNPLKTLAFVGRELIGVVNIAIRERNRHSRSNRERSSHDNNRSTRRFNLELTHQLRYATGGLRRAPGFTAPAALTLAVGIGATVAMFSVVRGVILEPLPYPDSERIVRLDHAAPGIGVERDLGLTRGSYGAYAERTDLFAAAAMYETGQLTLSYQGIPERVNVARVTPSTQSVFDTPPIVGRWFTEADGTPGVEPAAVISHDLWTRRFGSDPLVMGRTVSIQGVPTIIIGVMPRHFVFPDPSTQLWVPLQADLTTFGGFVHRAVARLRAGIDPSYATTQLNNMIPTFPDRFAEPFVASVVDDAHLTARVTTLHEDTVGHVKLTLWILLGSVGFIWLLACANVANLLLVRSEGRRPEMAIRTALGANRRHLVANRFAEIGVLTALGTAAGLGLAWLGTKLFVRLGPDNIPRLDQVNTDVHVIAFALALALVSWLLLGGVSATGLTSLPANALRSGGARTSAAAETNRFRRVVGIVQIAVAVVLLVGSGLMIRTFEELNRIDIGFSADSVLTFEIGLTEVAYPSRLDAAIFHRTLTEQLEGLPGVESVGAVGRCLPFGGWCGGDPLRVLGRPVPEGEIPPIVSLRSANAGYLDALHIPLLAGRWLDPGDESGVSNNVVVSAALADAYWPGEEPLGQRVSDQGAAVADSAWYTIVGVVGNVPARSITEIDVPTIYYSTNSRSGQGPSPHTMHYALKTTVDPMSLVPAVRRAVSGIDETVPVAGVRTLSQIVSTATAETTFVTVLLGVAAIMALFLGIVGVYSVVSYSVAQRRNEIGIRLALGATKTAVNRLVLGQGFALAGIGLIAGVGGAFALTRYMESLLYQVTPNDPLTYGAVIIVLTLAAFLASYIPARRAASLDPVRALREE